MRILLPGGSGQVGTILAWHLHGVGHEVTVLSRTPQAHASHPWRTLPWDGLTPAPGPPRSTAATQSSISPAAPSTAATTKQIVRPSSTHASSRRCLLGKLIAASPTPPRLWMNASTSTFYRHALDRPQDEFTGELGDLPSERGTREPANLPETWSFSIDVASSWERAFLSIPTPRTRKIRSALFDGDEPRPGRRLLRALQPRSQRPRRLDRLRAAVRLLDARPRLLPRYRPASHST